MSQKDNLKRKLEEKLAEMHGRKYCIIVSRGTVAIYLALKVLEYDDGKIVLPSILCLSPANAVIYAGLKPVYCDINLLDFNLDIDNLETILKGDKDIRAIILPHIYGQPTDIDKVINLAQKYKVKLIEDVAQAMGGRYKNKPLGSFGDFSILSFGHTKILDVGGGGALLFDDERYIKLLKENVNSLSLRTTDYKDLQEKYLKTYYTLVPLVGKESNFWKLYYSFPYIFKNLYLFRNIEVAVINNIYNSLRKLGWIVAKRNENAEYYRMYLQHEKIIHPKYNWQGVCWRYSFLIKGNHQLEIAEKIRKKGIHISNWYPPVHLLYELIPPKLKNAEYLGTHIFNLWVEPKYSKKNIKKIADMVMRVLDRNEL